MCYIRNWNNLMEPVEYEAISVISICSFVIKKMYMVYSMLLISFVNLKRRYPTGNTGWILSLQSRPSIYRTIFYCTLATSL
jgi:hypothetical protein